MLAIFAYIGASFVVAGILTTIYCLLRPMRNRDHFKSWKLLLSLTICTSLAPYAWAEVLTKIYSKGMEPVVKGVFDSIGIKGELRYFRVITCSKSKARIIAVGLEKASWGGTERPLVAITMIKDHDKWVADAYTVVSSLERNKDSFTLPPYW